MKILFLNSVYPQDCYEQLLKDAHGVQQVQSDVFQWAVIDGLERGGYDYTLACCPALPAWPGYRHLLTPKGTMAVNNKMRGHYLRYCSAPVLNQISRKIVLKKYVRNWCEQNREEDLLIAITYTHSADKIGAIVSLKKTFTNLVIAPIVTDLIDNALEFAANRKPLKRVQFYLEEKAQKRLFHKIDKYVLLTSQMTECIPEAADKYMVMEGVAPWEWIIPRERDKKDETVRSLLYTGTFQEFGGLRLLVDAFMQTSNPCFRLVLCGSGVLQEYVEEAARTDKRIIYKGRVSHEEVVRLQRSSTLLINPRRPNGGITKYSFPSKTMEYMSSLTPMIGYHLEGIPEEYYLYMYTPEDLSQESLTECINQTLSLPLGVLQEKADAAFEFVAKNKNSVAQIKRMINFLKA